VNASYETQSDLRFNYVTMIIECSTCHKRYSIDENKVPADTKQAKCKACGKNILLNPIPASPSSKQVKKVPATPIKSCPKCGHQFAEPKQNECPVCGIILNKYTEIVKRKREDEKREKAREEKERKKNIVNCLVCKKEISKNATSCPHCGEPLKKEQAKEVSKEEKDLQKFGCGCLLLIPGCFFIFLIYAMLTGSNSTTQNDTSSKTVSNNALDGSVYQVEMYLNKTLKDPDSFQAIEWSPVQETDTGYIVRCKYRAKNSFGGYVIENQIFILDKKGNVLSGIEQ
jgi:predicted Zn finger-like uncharacterized protein